ncbi:MAG TPA: hypothetical protein VGS41_16730, partial [Chthonomonadales bacterium]|nr:hypothetical protein [Chthonomonadales bacterium]
AGPRRQGVGQAAPANQQRAILDRYGKFDKTQVYRELVGSYRTERGPRQRVVAYLGAVQIGLFGRVRLEGVAADNIGVAAGSRCLLSGLPDLLWTDAAEFGANSDSRPLRVRGCVAAAGLDRTACVGLELLEDQALAVLTALLANLAKIL